MAMQCLAQREGSWFNPGAFLCIVCLVSPQSKDVLVRLIGDCNLPVSVCG